MYLLGEKLTCSFCGEQIREHEKFADVLINGEKFFLHNDNDYRPNTCLHRFLDKRAL